MHYKYLESYNTCITNTLKVTTRALQIPRKLQHVHYKYLESYNTCITNTSKVTTRALQIPRKLQHVHYKYLERGTTGQYWMGYIHMVVNWFQLSRSIREGDFDLYIYSLKNISKYFFCFNQPTYARWLTEYHSKLLKIKGTHPGVEEFRSSRCGGV